MAMHEHCQITRRKCCLAARDRVERDIRVGNDPLTIDASNSVVFNQPFGGKALFGHARCSGADLILRLKPNTLIRKAAVIDTGVNIERRQPLIDMIGPAFTPLLDKFGAVPVAHLRTEAGFVNRAHGQHDVRVWLGEAVRANIPMHIEIGDHPAFDKFSPNKIAGERDALLLVQFSRNGEFHFAR